MLIQAGHAVGFCVGLSSLEDGYLHVLFKGNLHNQQKSFCQHFYMSVCVCVCTCAHISSRDTLPG